MLDIMSTAANAIEAYDAQMRINSANIANLSVTGYKAMKISFQTIYENVLKKGTAASETAGGVNPVQLGSSVGIGGTKLDFTQGTISEANHLDLAVNGSGLLTISPDNQKMLYTKAGSMHVDDSGNLVTDNGMQVYGFSSGNLTAVTGLNKFNVPFLSWTDDGRLVQYNDDKWTETDPTKHYIVADTGYTVALTSFVNMSGLEQASGNAFASSIASGDPLPYEGVGGDFGTIVPRSIEQSNVFYTGEVIDSMEAQRDISANLTIVRMINDEITNFISRIS